MKTIDELKQDRINMLEVIASLTAELRNLKQERDKSADAETRDAKSKHINRILNSLNRANTHLSTVKEEIRAENVRLNAPKVKVPA